MLFLLGIFACGVVGVPVWLVMLDVLSPKAKIVTLVFMVLLCAFFSKMLIISFDKQVLLVLTYTAYIASTFAEKTV